MEKNKNIILIEPCFYGHGFVDAVYAKGYNVIAVVSDIKNPSIYGYDNKCKDVIKADIRSADSIVAAIKTSPYNKDFAAVMPANDYTIVIGAQVAEALHIKGLPSDNLVKARFKDATRKALEENGLPNARFGLVKNVDEAKVAAAGIGYPVVVKPTDCAGSQNVFLVYDEVQLEAAADRLLDVDESYLNFKIKKVFLVEEYISGDEFSVEVFMQAGKPLFSSVTEKIKSEPPYFVEIAHVVPASNHAGDTDLLKSSSVKYLNALGLNDGPYHVELRLSDRGPIVMEINPRPAGGRICQDLLPNAFGVDLFSATIDWYLDQPIDLKPKKDLASAVANFTVKKRGVVSCVRGLDKVSKMPGIVKNCVKIKVGDQVQPPQSGDDRYGYVISIGRTPSEAKKIALDAMAAIDIEL